MLLVIPNTAELQRTIRLPFPHFSPWTEYVFFFFFLNPFKIQILNPNPFINGSSTHFTDWIHFFSFPSVWNSLYFFKYCWTNYGKDSVLKGTWSVFGSCWIWNESNPQVGFDSKEDVYFVATIQGHLSSDVSILSFIPFYVSPLWDL